MKFTIMGAYSLYFLFCIYKKTTPTIFFLYCSSSIALHSILPYTFLYSNVIDNIITTGSQPVLFSLPPLDARRYFTWISKDLNAENILHWLGDVEHIYRWHEMYNLIVVKLAAAKHVPLIDIRKAFLESRDYLNMYCEDGIHPNEAGHALISNVIIRSALPMI